MRGWSQVALVFAFMVVNYADKAVMGLASVPIMRDLELSFTQFGELGSAFFLLFSLSGIAVGFLANRVRSKAIMLAMAMVWVCALLPVAWSGSFAVLLASRIVLGAAEGPAFPVALHAVYKWFADAERALPTSVVACGAAFGTGIVAPALTWIIVHLGWHAVFGTLSAAGLLWACIWSVLGKEGPGGRPAAGGADAHVSYRLLLSSRTAIGVFIAGFAAYWVIALNVVWLANYLVKALRVAPLEAAWIVALPAILQMLLAPLLAWLSQRLTARGLSTRIARGVVGSMCVATAGVSMICMALLPFGILKVCLIGVSFSIGSVMFTLGSTLIGEITPAAQRGAMLGITNSIHTLAGLAAPFVMGLVVDVGTDLGAGFRNGYLCAGALVAALGALAAALIEPEADLERFHRP
jgi:MFS family permease